jgi:hypothetical protein
VSEFECYQINKNMSHNFSQVPPKEGKRLSFPFEEDSAASFGTQEEA